ncbi:MAG TPA: type II toxin-antitoxin system VapC family toxin [Candidatus Ozemobacteraceae bacterium]|nr:type II toxin-antitoxin system VapC family toxin [Candidatus Ozemobacteraceae bacterium]
MNLVDSCGWLEYFADGPNADFFSVALFKTEQLIVPTICIYEVFKKVLSERDEDAAFQAAAMMRQGQVVELDDVLAISAARISRDLKIPMADSIILATSKRYDALIWTQDEHFKGIPQANYRIKKKAK